MLSKKMYPQNASRASSTKRFLMDRHTQKAEKNDDETQDKKQEICKWVKTDSECKFILYQSSVSKYAHIVKVIVFDYVRCSTHLFSFLVCRYCS